MGKQWGMWEKEVGAGGEMWGERRKMPMPVIEATCMQGCGEMAGGR